MNFFILFWSYWRCVFIFNLFLIYFSSELFDMIIIDFHWKGLHFSFVVKTFWHGWRKMFSIVLCLLVTTLFVYLWTYLDFHWKLKSPLYETTLSFIMNLLLFCISIIFVWWVECLIVWKLCKRTITSVIKYKYNTNAI